MNGWTYDDVRALPQDVYDELVAMLKEERRAADAAEGSR